jgi:hypothetical protein
MRSRIVHRLFAVALVVVAPAGATAQVDDSSENVIVGVPHDTVPTGWASGSWAGPCPATLPARVLQTLEGAKAIMAVEMCSSVVSDLDGDGLPDIVLTADLPSGDAFVVLLDGTPPSLLVVAERKVNDRLFSLAAGRHGLNGCYDDSRPTPAPDTLPDRIREHSDLRLEFSQPGFGITFEKFANYYHFEGRVLHEEMGSGC